MPWLRRAWRLGRLAAHIALGALLAALLLGERRRHRRPRLVRLIAWWHRGACRALGVDVIVRGQPAPAPVLLLSNHVSWLDIPVLGGAAPTRFLSKAEVRGWPLLGWLAARSGTLFLRRADRAAAEAATLEMIWALRRGERVLLFPEGTTTDGTGVRRFRSRLIEAAVLADTPVQPVALRFVEGEGADRAVPFVGEDAFLPHLVRLAGRAAVRAEVTFLDPLPARSAPREMLAARCEAGVRAVVEGRESAAPRVTAPPPAQRGSAPA